MTQHATVEQLLEGNLARVAVVRPSACGHACETCAGCGAAGQVLHATARNAVGAKPGDRVVICSDDRPVLQAAAAVYLLPIVTFFLGYGFSAGLTSLLARVIITLGCTALGGLPAVLIDRRSHIQFEITELL